MLLSLPLTLVAVWRAIWGGMGLVALLCLRLYDGGDNRYVEIQRLYASHIFFGIAYLRSEGDRLMSDSIEMEAAPGSAYLDSQLLIAFRSEQLKGSGYTEALLPFLSNPVQFTQFLHVCLIS